ncbi:hypothetical protein [Bergeyella zoohelcum]|uniref:hypothetical protein n=1 Tax=Bergeyella zoohelcum TaxID=1015 RepID=UPI00031B9C5B|nr:hypothetical protein [Bergeyella zoohelcum]
MKINHKPFSAAGIDRIRELRAKNRNCDTDEMYFHRNHNWEALSKNNDFHLKTRIPVTK